MAVSLQSCDPPPSPNSLVKTLDEEISPTAPIRALVSNSLALSSPIRQIQNQASPPAKPLTLLGKILVAPSSGKIEENECGDSQIMLQAQVSPDDNKILQIESTSYSLDTTRDSSNRPPRRYMADFDYQSDNDLKIKSTKPVQFSWLSLNIKPTGVGAGLDNSGNTCFIASVLQCFTHTVPLIESLSSYKYPSPCNCGNEKFCVMQALREQIVLALRSSGSSLKIEQFRDNLNPAADFSPDFQINNQEDAHEFLQSFLDKLERCCLTSRNVNIVEHVFGGRLLSRLQCCNCNSFSDTFEPSLGWSLEIEDVDNLRSALESFTRVEKLEDQITCDNCMEKVSKKKQLKLNKLPMVATFHLKRFKNDGFTMEKIFKKVRFPLELDLFPYTSRNENPEVSTKYHLYAMVEHLGNGVSFGHYTSYVRSAPETWHHFDDSKVRRVSEDCVLQRNAYLLYYAREGTPWFSSAFEELWPLSEANPLSFSPTSVLETACRKECVSDLSYKNVGYSNKACNNDLRCREPQEEAFNSAESISDDDTYTFDASESPKAYEFEKPFAETSHQEAPVLYPSDDKATIDDDDDVFVPEIKIQKQDSSPKRKAEERDITGDAYRRKPKLQKQDSQSKRQGTFQIQREHLQNKKKKEEVTRGTKLLRSIVAASADPKDKQYAISLVKRRPPTTRNLLLAAALGAPIKKKKISNIK